MRRLRPRPGPARPPGPAPVRPLPGLRDRRWTGGSASGADTTAPPPPPSPGTRRPGSARRVDDLAGRGARRPRLVRGGPRAERRRRGHAEVPPVRPGAPLRAVRRPDDDRPAQPHPWHRPRHRPRRAGPRRVRRACAPRRPLRGLGPRRPGLQQRHHTRRRGRPDPAAHPGPAHRRRRHPARRLDHDHPHHRPAHLPPIRRAVSRGSGRAGAAGPGRGRRPATAGCSRRGCRRRASAPARR